MKSLEVKEIDQIVEYIVRSLSNMGEKISQLFHGFSFQGMFSLLLLIITQVEAAVSLLGGVSGEDKKRIVSRVLNRLIDVPFMLETLEAVIFDMLVDTMVEYLNKIYGNNWLEKVKLGQTIKLIEPMNIDSITATGQTVGADKEKGGDGQQV